VDEETEVEFHLTSTPDTFLYLLEGTGTDGDVKAKNDDVVSGSDTNSRITITLEAGSYTAEAATYNARVTGEFTLTITPSTEAETPPTDSCVIDLGALTQSVSQDGTWDSACDSTNRSSRYAQFYSFTLAQETAVQIDLTSSTDPYMFLLQGAGRDGSVEAENDDVVSGTDTNSRISLTLAAGAYTVEATTYSVGATGSFNLAITGPSGGTPSQTTNASCETTLGTITASTTRSGSWSSACASSNRSGRYAHFYTFTLSQQGTVQIDLTSTKDPYLFLLNGAGTDGTVEAENDDVVPNVDTNSRISATLNAGTYTAEATTYDAGITGNFALTISP
jgi:hypothetical protein